MVKRIILVLMIVCLGVLAVACGVKPYVPDDDPVVEMQQYVVADANGNLALQSNLIVTEQDTAYAAYQLYEAANRVWQNRKQGMSFSTCYVVNPIVLAKKVVGQTEAHEVKYLIKNGDEYLSYDVRAKSTGAPAFGKAKYAQIGLNNSYYVEVDNGVVTAKWDSDCDFDKPKVSKTAEPTDSVYFHASQEPKFNLTEAYILPNTISTASIEHNDAEGYYTVQIELDVSNPKTTEILLPNLRSGGGVMTSNAKYTSMSETIEIWDDGSFKAFRSVDNWEAGIVKCTIDYNTTFSYTDDDCDMSVYYDNFYATIKSLCEQANAQ